MLASELRSKSVEELKATVVELRKEQFSLRMQKAAGNANLNEFRRVRKDIARIKTVINELNSGDK